MKKEYILKGLNCANCAAKIEAAAGALPGVTSAGCNALNASLSLVLEDNYSGDITEEIKRIVRLYEPDVIVTVKTRSLVDAEDENCASPWRLICFISGVILFAAAFALPDSVKVYLYIASYALLGYEVIFHAFTNLFGGSIFDENLLMTIASIGALVIGEYPEATAVMMFYIIGEYFQGLAVRRSRRSISELMDIRPDYANIEKNGEIISVSPEDIEPGSIIIVKPGEKIPLDGIIKSGSSLLDTRALTGEVIPRRAEPGEGILSGCVNQTGLLTIEVTKPYGESTAAKILDMVENASNKKAPTESFITTFSRYYTPVVTGLAALLAIVPPLISGGGWADWVQRALVFLVISCPCALVISIPLGFFGGVGRASRSGILVKGSNYLEALSKLDIVVFDKTGTLTKGVFKVTETIPADSITAGELIEYAALAESYSNHPVAAPVREVFGAPVNRDTLTDYEELPGLGVSVTFNGSIILAGNAKLMVQRRIEITESDAIGTKVYVAVGGIFAGCIVVSDEIKPDSRNAINDLKALGVRHTVMLTGDNRQLAEAIAGELHIDEFHAQLLPGEKVNLLEAIDEKKRQGGKLAFVGDGVNDAPVLARADVGVAMGGLGSDAAIEAADVVLMTDEPSKLGLAVKIARKTRLVVWENIVFALGVKAVFLILGAFGISGMWEAVFADVGVSLLAILNSLRLLKK